jgi:chromate transport protein ChrA
MRWNIAPFVLREVVSYFFKLGWLAFGGPVGQVGLMHLDCVERRGWISEEEFVRALNFCHVLPGPEATQLAIYIGWRKAGILGGILAGALFILPGLITLTGLAWIYVHFGQRREVLGVLWGFRPVGLALLCAALVRISRAALKSVVQVVLAAAALGAFHFAGVPFPIVLVACGLLYVGWRHALPAAAEALVLFPRTAMADPLLRLRDISWFSSFLFVLPAAPHLERLASGRAKEFLAGITAGVVGVMVSVSIVLARVAVSPAGRFDPWTVVVAAVAFGALVFWKYRLNVVVVVLGGGLLGLLRVALH